MRAGRWVVFTGEGCEGRMVSGKARLGLRQLGEGDLCIHSFIRDLLNSLLGVRADNHSGCFHPGV